jgi:DNA polymerase
MSSKSEQLEAITREVQLCECCSLCEEAKNRVLGEGNPDSPVFFIGEAPGRREDETGRPFVGSAGKLFDILLAKVNLAREKVFIGNIVKCRPPGNRRPGKEEINSCSQHLEKQLSVIKPKVIAPMGNSAVDYIFEKYGIEKKVIGAAHGRSIEVMTCWGKVMIYPLYHPAAAIYNRELLSELEIDMASLRRLLELL